MSAIPAANQRIAPTLALDAAPAQRKLLYIFTYLAAVTAVQILHLAMDDIVLNIGFSGGLTAGFVYSYFLEQRFRALTIYIDSALAAGLAVYYYTLIQRDQTMYGNYLGILLGILMVSLAFKAFAPGDFRFILIPSTICVMFSSVASYDLKFMLLLPVFLVFAGSALYISNQVEVAVRVAGTTGAELNLRFAVNRSFFWELLRVVLGIIILSVMVYVVVPHSSTANRSLILNSAQRVDEENQSFQQLATEGNKPGQTQSNEIGLGDDFDLSAEGELSSNPVPVLRMKSNRKGYLRAQVYDVFTGSGWVQSAWLNPPAGRRGMLISPSPISLPYQPHGETINTFSIPLVDFPSPRYQDRLLNAHQISISDGNIFSTNDSAELNFEIVRQEVTLLQAQPPYYFAVFQPFRLENISLAKDDRLLDQPLLDQASCLRPDDLTRVHPKEFSYTVYSLEPRAGPAKLKQVYVAGPPAIVKRYTQLPLSAEPSATELSQLGISREQYRAVSQRLRNFAVTTAGRLGQGSDATLSLWDKVQAIYEFLSNEEEFTYTRQYSQANPQQEVTEAFVMGSRQGYCRHFSSAMAVMCRLNGIAARVVTGYAPGAYSFVDNAYIVKASNAHAWVEVYFDEYGWITFDPTPASQDVVTRGATTERLAGVVDFLQELFVLDPAGTQKTIVAALAAAYDVLRRNWPLTALALGLVLLAATGWWGVRQLPRRRQIERILPENNVVAAYLALGRELARLGLVAQPSSTPRQHLGRAAGQFGDLAAPLQAFIPVYERAAFAPGPVEPEDAAAAENALRTVRQYIADELARSRRK